MHTMRVPRVAFALVLAAVAASAAVGAPTGPADDDVEAVRLATARFADIEVAKAEGWSTEVTACMESEAGGQGYHYGNMALIENDILLDPSRPELLMYEPQADGSMEFVGVEWAVPVAAWQGDTPPTVLGREMHVNEKFGVWVLHVWWRDNPSGQYTDWNPAVSCAVEAS